jgi:uncharacterized protein YcbK (DUF882 family)
MSNAADLEHLIDLLKLRHFSGAELTAYWTRKRGKVQNSMPHESLWPNIVPTLIVADELREQIGAACTILSSYRSPAYNAAVGGERASLHMQFRALDLTFTKGTPQQWQAIARKLRGTKFKLPDNGGNFVWKGGIGLYVQSHFIHIDTRGYDANWQGN